MHRQLPQLLRDMIRDGRWVQPSNVAVARLVPFDELPFQFHLTESEIASDTLHDLLPYEVFKLYSSRRGGISRPLPWLDIDNALCIAGGSVPGSDSAIALDYRISTVDPRVVASNWKLDGTCHWQEIAPNFLDFVQRLEN